MRFTCQVNVRDAFGNRCFTSVRTALRCKLVCSSSDGAPTFVEATDAVVVSPFVQVHAQQAAPPPRVITAAPASRAAAAAVAQSHDRKPQRADESDATGSFDDDASLVGDMDIGR